MSDLRQRKPASAVAHVAQPERVDGDTKKNRQAKTPSTLSSSVYILLSWAAVGAAYFALKKLNAPSPLLPDTYALCSRWGSNIYTVDPVQPQVQCIVVEGARIIDRGSMVDIHRHWKDSGNNYILTVKYLPEGSIALPGLSDSHAHILEYGASRLMPLSSAKNVQEAVSIVREYVLAHITMDQDSNTVIEGWGWDHTAWPGQEWPTADALDSDPALKDKRIVLQSKDGHALWASSAVMKTISDLPEIVEGGIIVHGVDGKPSGVFIDNAQSLIKRPPLSDEDLARRFKATVDDAHAKGLTSVHDAALTSVSAGFFKRRAEVSALPLRVYGMRWFDEDNYWGDKVERILDVGRLTARSVKIFADGALRSGGAALHEPYHDNHNFRGIMRVGEEVLNSVIPRFLADGWQVNVHAIGDRANAVVLDAFEVALEGTNVTALRPRLEHAQILSSIDVARIAKLGVIASIQPTHAISDMWYAEDRLGPERVKGLYAFRSILDNGGRITLGTDFPVEKMDPLLTFYAAITRLSSEGDSPHGPGGWFPEQCLTRDEALKGMTLDPAFASFSEANLGSLSVGKIADYVVLSQDIMRVPVTDILSTQVLATVMDGRPVYGKI